MLLTENILTNFEDDDFNQLHWLILYLHGNFQNTEAATEGFFKNFTKFIRKCLCQILFFNKGDLFKNNFFASDCFSMRAYI